MEPSQEGSFPIDEREEWNDTIHHSDVFFSSIENGTSRVVLVHRDCRHRRHCNACLCHCYISSVVEKEKAAIMSEMQANIGETLLAWYDQHARVLPWRGSQDPYRIWLSEIMLQQTRVDTVMEYYSKWLMTFPTLQSFAEADEERVLKKWQGLGYYSRVRHFHQAAKHVIKMYGEDYPKDIQQWITLPGVGAYTAAAICSIAFQQNTPVFDGNVLRVMSRMLAIQEDPKGKKVLKRLQETAKGWMDPHRPGDYNQAMMDLGATICLPNGVPKCDKCPLSAFCCIAFSDSWRVIPPKKEKKARKVEERTVFIYCVKDKIFLQKRSEKGLLASLWELPSVPNSLNEIQSEEHLVLSQGLIEESVFAEPIFQHIFSHLEWKMKLWVIYLRETPPELQGVWVNLDDLTEKYSIPTAFSDVLHWFITYNEIKIQKT